MISTWETIFLPSVLQLAGSSRISKIVELVEELQQKNVDDAELEPSPGKNDLKEFLYYNSRKICFRLSVAFIFQPKNAVLPFFENSLKWGYFCLITALFDYHCTQILCEVEEQATCMPMSPGCLSNSGPH